MFPRLATLRSQQNVMRLNSLLIFVCLAMPLSADTVVEDPLERQTLDIAKDLRCAVCQNQPVSESNADLARDMRAIIREQLVAGKSRAEIVDYFVARYGDYILLKPPYQGTGLMVWILPAVLALILAASAIVYLRRRRHVPLSPPPALSAEDRARVREARLEDQG